MQFVTELKALYILQEKREEEYEVGLPARNSDDLLPSLESKRFTRFETPMFSISESDLESQGMSSVRDRLSTVVKIAEERVAEVLIELSKFQDKYEYATTPKIYLDTKDGEWKVQGSCYAL